MKSIMIGEQARIPEWVHDHESYRRWVCSGALPDQGRYAYLDGHLWVDLSMERSIHSQLVVEFTRVLATLAKDQPSSLYYGDRMLLTNLDVGLSTEPDGTFIRGETLEEGTASVIEGDEALEILGSPDMTLEVISPTTVEKDTVHLRRLYWEAGIEEYWLVDSREKTFSFDILRRGTSKFVTTRKQQGWIKSQVFGREFKLTKTASKHGVSKFTLEVR